MVLSNPSLPRRLGGKPASRDSTDRLSACASIGFVSPVPFEVQSEELEDGIRAFTIRGELDMNTAPEFEKGLEQALSESAGSIMLDLSACEFIDSTGIALIVRAWQRLGADRERRLVLCCSNHHQVRRLLKITGVDSSISMHERRDAALAELRG